MGCFRTIGCLVVVVVALAAGWFFRDRLPWAAQGEAVAVATTGPRWEPLTPEGAARARVAVRRLSERPGPAFTNVAPGDLAAYVFEELSRQLPPSAENAEAAVIGDRLHVRAQVNLTDFGGARALGPLGELLSGREPVQFGGTLEVVRPGLAQYHVRSFKVRELSIPAPAIPKLLRNIRRGERPEGLADDALPLVIPRSIGDVRIANGRVTLYRST